MIRSLFAHAVVGTLLPLLAVGLLAAGDETVLPSYLVPTGADVIAVSPLTDRIVLVQFSEGIIDYAGQGQDREANVPHYGLLDVARASTLARYRLGSRDDPAFAGEGLAPVAVGRKSKGDQFNDLFAYNRKQPTHLSRHWIYLEFPTALTPGRTYTLTLDKLAANSDVWSFTFDESTRHNEAIHLNQVGFRPQAPKFAYVSQFMGDFDHGRHHEGGLDLSDYDGEVFEVVRLDDGRVVHRGKLALQKPKGERDTWTSPDNIGPSGNFSRADVWQADFSAVTEPGRYRLTVRRMGNSFPFEIGDDVYRRAWVTAMRGLFFMRAGIDRQVREYGDIVYPGEHRDHLFYLPNGDRKHSEKVADTSRPVTGVWGWYHDAGDWDCYPYQHSIVPALLLLAYDLDPARFGDGDVGNRWRLSPTDPWIDEGSNGIPDILDEAGWLVAFMRRARQALVAQGYGTGGVPAYVGIEGCGKLSTGSWADTRDLALHGEDAGITAQYAGLAAWYGAALRRAGQPAETTDPWLAEAAEAWRWAIAHGASGKDVLFGAAGLYRGTGDPAYQTAMLAAVDAKMNWDYWNRPGHDHVALSLYAILSDDHPGLDRDRRQAVRSDIISKALPFWLREGPQRGFRATHLSRAQQIHTGALSAPRALFPLVAQAFTGEAPYGNAAQFAADYCLGGNQMSLVWMSGLGWRSDGAFFSPDSWCLINPKSLVYPCIVLPGFTTFGARSSWDFFGPGYKHTGDEDFSRSTAYPVIWRKTGASLGGQGPAYMKSSEIPNWASKDSLGDGPRNDTLFPVGEWRFPNKYSIAASEGTVHGSMSHPAFTYAGLLGTFRGFTPEARPTVQLQLQLPADSQATLGDTVRLKVKASTGVVRVEYYYGWHVIGASTVAADGFALSWDTARFKLAAGEQRLTAKAFTSTGLESLPSPTAEVVIGFRNR